MQEIDYSLAVGTMIGDYRIIDILGVGGFGITYKAEDTRMQRLVALKEFLPQELAGRSNDASSVIPKTNCTDDYQYGLKKFLDEARTLAKFNHPNIVRAYTFVEENSTAYLVMEYVEGEALDEHLKKIHFNGNMAESRIREIIEPILKGLAQVHKAGLLHRDIKPGNIYLQNSSDSTSEHGNNPMLIDFGAARQSVGEKSKSISAIISQGYAPPEQYTTRGKQGPYTDIYAIGAVIYYLVTGTKPVESTDRQHEIMDEQPDPLTVIEKDRGYSDALVDAISKAMVLRISNRAQDVSELQSLLSGVVASSSVEKQADTIDPDATRKISKYDAVEADSSQIEDEPLPSSGGVGKFIVVILVLLAIGAGGYGFWQFKQQRAEEHAQLMVQDGKAWAKARKANTIKAYNGYKIAFKQGRYLVEAKQALDSLIEIKNKKDKLEARKVSLTVYTIPDESTIKILNIKDVYQDGIRLLPGNYKIQVSKSGFKTKTVDFTLDNTDTVNIELEKVVTKGSVNINVQPFDSVVKVLELNKEIRKGEKLPDGNYTFSITAIGYITQRHNWSVKTGKELLKYVNLKKEKAIENIEEKQQIIARIDEKNSAAVEVLPIVRIEPKYPIQAARDGKEGWVKMSFTINEIGGVEDVMVIAGEPKRIFNKEAKRALKKWKYKPKIVNGKAVKQIGLTTTLTFSL